MAGDYWKVQGQRFKVQVFFWTLSLDPLFPIRRFRRFRFHRRSPNHRRGICCGRPNGPLACLSPSARRGMPANRTASSVGNRSRTSRGLVHFSAKKRILPTKRRPKTWTCPLPAAPGGQSHFRGGQVNLPGSVPRAAKIGTVPCERLPSVEAIVSEEKTVPGAFFSPLFLREHGKNGQ